MIFQHTYQKVLRQTKTQTRRLVHPRDFGLYRHGRIEEVWRVHKMFEREYAEEVAHDVSGRPTGDMLLYPANLRWKVGRTYAVQPGRGKPAVARIMLIGIRLQQLQEITEGDAYAEGFWVSACPVCMGRGRVGNTSCLGCNGTGIVQSARKEFMAAWNAMYPQRGRNWDSNPLVWVLEFELVKEGKNAKV